MIAALAAGLAWADVVDEPPSCPPYASPRVSHGGAWCEPAPECGEGGVCADGACRRDVGVCVVEETVECGGFQPDTAEPCTFVRRTALGLCRGADDCDQGACEVADRCVVEGPLAPCGCASPGAGSVAVGAVLLGLAARRGVRRSPRGA